MKTLYITLAVTHSSLNERRLAEHLAQQGYTLDKVKDCNVVWASCDTVVDRLTGAPLLHQPSI